MKKIMFFAVVIISSVLFLSACKKDAAINYPIEGLWVGKYGVGTSAATNGYSMVLEAGGTFVIADGASIAVAPASSRATGTYTINGSTFKGTYKYHSSGTYSLQANFNSSGKLESGTWGIGTSVTDGGTWFMDRKN
jgi:hypothetical protein